LFFAYNEPEICYKNGEFRVSGRRVNVLEHVVIPELRGTIRFIYDKLAEAERDNTTRLMKIADIIRA
jgi:V/A-type H+-transporting ATPase subunit D